MFRPTRFSTMLGSALHLVVWLAAGVAAAGTPEILLLEDFRVDPIRQADTVLRGEAQARLAWNDDAPAFAGDRPGSLTARYDALLPTGLLGRPLARPLHQGDSFAAAFAYSIRSEGFVADIDGFFQISFGLWNSATTGLERTGTPANFATDSFDHIAMDWFPNVSPFFGGPFVSPALFGAANLQDPGFPFSGAFANAAFYFGPPAALPLDTPLLTLIVHDAEAGTIRFESFAIEGARKLRRLPQTSALIERSGLSFDAFVVDTAGPLMWRDGFSGPAPSLRADVDFHGMAVAAGEFEPLLLRFFPALFATEQEP